MDGRAARVRGVVRDCGLSSSWSGGISYHAAPHAHRHCASHVAATGVCAVARARFGSSAQHTCRRSPPDPARLRVKSKKSKKPRQHLGPPPDSRLPSGAVPAARHLGVPAARGVSSPGSFEDDGAEVRVVFMLRTLSYFLISCTGFCQLPYGTHPTKVRGGTVCTVYSVRCSL